MNRLIECVPNFSEGRDPAVVDEIARAIAGVEGVLLLDRHMDEHHHRSVITFAAPPEVVGEAAVRGVGAAARRIDLTRHHGEHPRIGAADVVPFVPLEGVTIEDCVAVARWAGSRIWERYRIPVYYYEAAADGVRLEQIRRDLSRPPDVGGPERHPTAGATAVGARTFLIAYNLFLATDDVTVARRIARRIRESSGGLPCVKALGIRAGGRAQVSMNLTDFERTPIPVVYEAVRREAAREGTSIGEVEIVGLIPAKAAIGVSGLDPGKILENRLTQALAGSIPHTAG